MSDTSAPTTPPSAPAPQQAPAAPQRNEVVVDPNPTASPSPIPSQAPPAPDKGDKPPPSRRESIQKALAESRAKNPPQPREAKRGDNNPPEETPDEKFDLKKRPGEQSAKIDQPRERGRFAPKAAPDGQAQPNVGAQAGRPPAQPGVQVAPQPYRPPPGAPAHHHPLPRMSPRAAADWDKVPDTVRADGHRMYAEVNQALQRYKGAHDYMQTIAPYVKMAHEQGTSLDRVLANHVGIEEKLRTDVHGGFEVIAHNLNLHTPEGQKLTFLDICYDYINRSPEQRQMVHQRNQAQAMQMQIEQMRAQQQALANEYRRMQYAQHFQMTRGAVDQYAGARPRFDELGPLIKREIDLGFDLDTAYRRAELLAGPTAAQTRTQTPAQTRTPDRSISGAPGGAPNGATRTGKPVSRKEALERAFRHHSGSL